MLLHSTLCVMFFPPQFLSFTRLRLPGNVIRKTLVPLSSIRLIEQTKPFELTLYLQDTNYSVQWLSPTSDAMSTFLEKIKEAQHFGQHKLVIEVDKQD